MSEPEDYKSLVSEEADQRLYKDGLIGKIRPSLAPLAKRFVCPPFSILNAREGVWQHRKRAWLRLGIKSEVGRTQKGAYFLNDNETLMGYASRKRKEKKGREFGVVNHSKKVNFEVGFDGKPLSSGQGPYTTRTGGTSVFDPVLCELAYSWWCPPGGIVVDPFAGGSVRGIVSSILGLKYWGCELRSEQVEANKKQLDEIPRGKYKPKWVCGDSMEKLSDAPPADFVFSCPPYGNLEKYSEDEKDLSSMTYEDFLISYGEIISRTCECLKENRFACFVVSNYRDYETRVMHDLVGDTIRLFVKAGLRFWTEAVLITAVGTAAIRANRTFIHGNRKLVRTHQNVLVFVKGEPEVEE